MNYYIVFASRKWKNVLGETGVSWEAEAIGVFQADNPEQACLAAAHKAGKLTTMFAIPGFPWGLDMVEDQGIKELGQKVDPLTRLEKMGARLEKSLLALAPAQVDHELTEGTPNDAA